ENLKAKDIMCEAPKNMDKKALAYDALQLMEEYNINQLVVMDGEKYQGIIHIHEIIKEGLV
ncbi:MAG: arabinose-5-phosphate isomerase, partial [Flavobacteriales bacterium]